MTRYTLNDSHDGTELRLRAGDVVILRLQENPETGERWEIVAAQGFVLEADDFTRAPSGGGERALRFKVDAEGAAWIDAVLRQSSEIVPPLRSFSVRAAVG